MHSLGHSLVPRCLAVWAAVLSAGASVCALVADDLQPLTSPSTDADLEAWLVAVAAAAIWLAACWAGGVTTVVCAQVLRDRSPTERVGGSSGVPAPVRRLLLRACGVAVAGGLAGGLVLSPAGATPGSLERDRSATSSAAATSAPGSATTPASRQVPVARDRVVVRPGDSLWRIAEAELLRRHGVAPSVAQVAAYWPRIHAANRALVGPDPDLVRPGVPLVLPAPHPQES